MLFTCIYSVFLIFVYYGVLYTSYILFSESFYFLIAIIAIIIINIILLLIIINIIISSSSSSSSKIISFITKNIIITI